MPVNKTRVAGNKNPESARSLKARAFIAAAHDGVDGEEAPKVPGLKAIKKEKTIKAKRRNVAQAMLDDAATAAEILMAENPKHAGLIGLDSQLFAQGAHEPVGSSIQKGKLTPVFDNNTTAIGRWSRRIKTVSLPSVMFVELGGHRKAAMDILKQAAAVRGKETIITNIDKSQGAKLGLSHKLTIDEKRDLANLGARILSATGEDLKVKRTDGKKSGKTGADVVADFDIAPEFVKASSKSVSKVNPTWANDPVSVDLDRQVTEAEIAIFENHELASRRGLVTELVKSGHHLPTELAELRAAQAEETVAVDEPQSVGPALIL